MSTKYTREQIDKARQLADHAFDEGKEDRKYHSGERHPGETWIDTFTEALGLDVESEKPEPGTLLRHKETGDLAWTDIHGRYKCISPADGEVVWWATVTPDDFEPARVVAATERLISEAPGWEQDLLTGAMRKAPAVQVELSEAEVGKLWDDTDPGHFYEWADLSTSTRTRYAKVTNAAIAKHGHGRVEVSRDDVQAAADRALERTRGWTYARSADVTDLMMELLEGSK